VEELGSWSRKKSVWVTLMDIGIIVKLSKPRPGTGSWKLLCEAPRTQYPVQHLEGFIECSLHK
jgi:hypothetical protein